MLLFFICVFDCILVGIDDEQYSSRSHFTLCTIWWFKTEYAPRKETRRTIELRFQGENAVYTKIAWKKI